MQSSVRAGQQKLEMTHRFWRMHFQESFTWGVILRPSTGVSQRAPTHSEPIAGWHREVHHNQVRMQLLSFFNRLLPVLSFSAHFKVGFAFEDFAERLTDQRIVIHDQDSLRHRQTPWGIEASTVLAATSWMRSFLSRCVCSFRLFW